MDITLFLPPPKSIERYFNRQWPWVQSGFLTLHSLVMIMKMHSYASVNGILHDISQRSQRALAHLRRLTEDPSIGGWRKAVLDARAHLESNSSEACSEAVTDPPIKSREAATVTTNLHPDTPADALRRRSVAAPQGAVVELPDATTPGTSSPSASDVPTIDLLTSVSTLAHHPCQPIASVAQEFLELDAELVSTGPERVRYPQNLTWRNFCTYMLIPTLVYELEYPRTDR